MSEQNLWTLLRWNWCDWGGQTCKVATIGSKRHCEMYAVTGEGEPNGVVVPYIEGHVCGEEYRRAEKDDFRPMHPERFVGRTYIGVTAV